MVFSSDAEDRRFLRSQQWCENDWTELAADQWLSVLGPRQAVAHFLTGFARKIKWSAIETEQPLCSERKVNNMKPAGTEVLNDEQKVFPHATVSSSGKIK
jgi:hypothetical protein